MSPNLILDRYKIIKTMTGGMGVVHLCIDTAQGDLPVALKMVKQEYLSDPGIRVKFLSEANIWIKLGWHPNIVHAHRVEYLPDIHNVYVVTELIQAPHGLPDPSLRSWVNAGFLNLEKSLKFGLQIVRGMLHATSIFPDLVHRDLKPENILVGVDEVAKVNDFGIASTIYGNRAAKLYISDDEQNKQTTHHAIGTVNYMSPEQIQGLPLDVRSDIYAFGLLLEELIVGKPVISSIYMEQMIYLHLSGQAIKNTYLNIQDTHLQQLIINCVHKDKNKRFTSWQDLEKAYINIFKAILGTEPPDNDFPIDVSLYGVYQKAGSYLSISASYSDLGDYKASRAFCKVGLNMAREVSSPILEADALTLLGHINFMQGFNDDAIDNYNDSLQINFKLYNLISQAINLANLGGAYHKLGEVERARDYFFQSLALARSEKLIKIMAAQYGNLGVSFAEEGEFNKAIAYYHKAIGILLDNDDKFDLINQYSNLANTYFLINDLISAEKYYLLASDLAEKLASKRHQCIILGNLANIFIANQQYTKALDTLMQAKTISHEIEDWGGFCKHLASIASIFCALNRFGEADKYYQKALKIATTINETRTIGQICFGIGNMRAAQGNMRAAIPEFVKCIDISNNINDKYTEAGACGNLGKTYAALFNYPKAIYYLEKSMSIAENLGAKDIRARAAWTLGVIYEINSQIGKAIPLMEYAVHAFKEFGLPEYEAAIGHLKDVRALY